MSFTLAASSEMLSLDTLKYHLRNAPVAGGIGYLSVIFAIHRHMAARERALTIPKSVMVMYNLVQVVINAYVAYVIAHAVGGWVFGLGVKDSPELRHGVYLHYLCKVRPPARLSIAALLPGPVCLSRLAVPGHGGHGDHRASEKVRAAELPPPLPPLDDCGRVGVGRQHVAGGGLVGHLRLWRVD